MRIQRIEAIPLAYPIPNDMAYGMARGLVRSRTCTLVRVWTDEGVEGVGEAWGPPQLVVPHVRLLAEHFTGQDPWNYEILAERWLCSSYHLRQQGMVMAALSGIEVALYDILGKMVGKPVAYLLGGMARQRVMAYASTGYFTDSGNGFAHQIEEAVEEGFWALKIKVGRGLTDDVRRIEQARRLAGEDRLLLVDVNGAYTCDGAAALMSAIRHYDVFWVEEPVDPADRSGLRQLRAASSDIPLAAGEAECSPLGFRDLISERLVDVVQPDVTKCGGVLAAREIARMAQRWYVRVSPHCWGGAVALLATLHLVASLPETPHVMEHPWPLLLELDRAPNGLRDHLLAEPLEIRNGYVTVPQKPGLGAVLDEAAIRRYRLD